MKLSVDKRAVALYRKLDDSTVAESVEVSAGVTLDFNEHGEVVAIEMLNLSERSSRLNLNTLQFLD